MNGDLLPISENGKVAKRILSLCKLLSWGKDTCNDTMYSEHVRVMEDDKGFSWLIFDVREPEKSHAITPDGMVIEHTCEYSHHNGSSYGDKKRLVTDPREAYMTLKAIERRVEARALAKEERLLEEQANRLRTERAKINLETKLRERR